MDISLKLARIEDLSKIHKMQQETFAGFTEKYHSDIANLEKEDLAETIKRFHRVGNSYYFITKDDVPAGVICTVTDMRQPMKHLSLLWVQPEYQRQGLGQKAIKLVERMYGKKNWTVNAIKQDKDAIRFYENAGYKQTDDVKNINENLSVVLMSK